MLCGWHILGDKPLLNTKETHSPIIDLKSTAAEPSWFESEIFLNHIKVIVINIYFFELFCHWIWDRLEENVWSWVLKLSVLVRVQSCGSQKEWSFGCRLAWSRYFLASYLSTRSIHETQNVFNLLTNILTAILTSITDRKTISATIEDISFTMNAFEQQITDENHSATINIPPKHRRLPLTQRQDNVLITSKNLAKAVSQTIWKARQHAFHYPTSEDETFFVFL